jgi:hypothetical protein
LAIVRTSFIVVRAYWGVWHGGEKLAESRQTLLIEVCLLSFPNPIDRVLA